MKVRYESDDGMVSGYGDEGKAAVEAHESDPLAQFNFPWTWDGHLGLLLNRDGLSVGGAQFQKMILLGSRLAPLVQEAIAAADEKWGADWSHSNWYANHLGAMKKAMKETLNG